MNRKPHPVMGHSPDRLRALVTQVSPLFGNGFAKPEVVLLPDGIAIDTPGVNYAGYLTFRDEFVAGLDARFHTAEWLDGQVQIGALRTIATTDAALLFEVREYPTGAVELHVIDAVGNLDVANTKLRPALETYARDSGCGFSKISALSEWVKPLSTDGYEQHRVSVRKEF